MTVAYLTGDARKVVASLPAGSVDLVASSPPFLGLRSYLPGDHPAKGDEIGQEQNPAEFIDALLTATVEWGRVLTPHGSIVIELGDTYSGSPAGATSTDGNDSDGRLNSRITTKGRPKNDMPDERFGPGRDWDHERGRRAGKRDTAYDGWPEPKCLALIPQLYAVALAYGLNPLTGEPSPAGRWLVRNVIVWYRPNPTVGQLADKFRPAQSYITVATRSPRRWFDLTAVRRVNPRIAEQSRVGKQASDARDTGAWQSGGDIGNPDKIKVQNPEGGPPHDVWFDEYDFDFHDTWVQSTEASGLAHYAMWPAKLADRIIQSMCPREVCTVCGAPRRRLEAKTPEYEAFRSQNTTTLIEHTDLAHARHIPGKGGIGSFNPAATPPVNRKMTLGWSDCGHDSFRAGHVLDPFCGTGTTLAVADLRGRDATGVDLDESNRDLYDARWDECKRVLFGTAPEIPGQESLFA